MEKNFALCATKKINILTLVLSEKKFLNETKNHNPLLQVKWSVPNSLSHPSPGQIIILDIYHIYKSILYLHKSLLCLFWS